MKSLISKEQRDFFACRRPLTLQSVSWHLIRDSCLSKDNILWSNTFNIFIVGWSPRRLCAWREILFALKCLMFSNHFLCHFVFNDPHVLVMCKLSQALSNYLHIFISNSKCVFEAHKWISSRGNRCSMFPPHWCISALSHTHTHTLLSNLEELCSGLKHQRAARHSPTHCCIIKGEMFASVASSVTPV